MASRILLLGSGGQLGEILGKKLESFSDSLLLQKSDLDICDFTAVRKIISDYSPGVVINAAAYTRVDDAEAEQDTAFKINSEAVRNIASSVDAETQVVQVSTDFVFDGKSFEPYKPTADVNPLSIYGKSKLEGERQLLQAHPDNSIVLRTSWLYSARHKNFVTTMLRLLQEKDELGVVNDQRGSPTCAYTLAEIILRIIELEPHTGIYHWSDKGDITWYDFAVEIQTQALELGLLTKKIPLKPITTAQFPTPAVRPQYSVLDTSSTEKLLGISTVPWKLQLARVLKIIIEEAAK